MQNRLGVIVIKRKQLIIFILAFVVVFLGMNYFKLSDNFLGNKKYVYVLGNVVGIRANTEGVLVLGYEDKKIVNNINLFAHSLLFINSWVVY